MCEERFDRLETQIGELRQDLQDMKQDVNALRADLNSLHRKMDNFESIMVEKMGDGFKSLRNYIDDLTSDVDNGRKTRRFYHLQRKMEED
jgi:phage shock protein A